MPPSWMKRYGVWWYYGTGVSCGVGAAVYTGYLYQQYRGARHVADRDKGILRITAVTTSKQTVKAVITDKEILQSLKHFGIEILKAEETKQELKKLVKDRIADQRTREGIKTFLGQRLLKDRWVLEEVVIMVGDIANSIKRDNRIFPMPLLLRLGSAAIQGLKSELFQQNLKKELWRVFLEIIRGPPVRPPSIPAPPQYRITP